MGISIGFICSGGIARTHMGSLQKIPDAKMVAFAMWCLIYEAVVQQIKFMPIS